MAPWESHRPNEIRSRRIALEFKAQSGAESSRGEKTTGRHYGQSRVARQGPPGGGLLPGERSLTDGRSPMQGSDEGPL